MPVTHNCKCVICNKPVYRSPSNMPKNVTCSKKCRASLNKLLKNKIINCNDCSSELFKNNSRLFYTVYTVNNK